jgi:hypothetical protein
LKGGETAAWESNRSMSLMLMCLLPFPAALDLSLPLSPFLSLPP